MHQTIKTNCENLAHKFKNLIAKGKVYQSAGNNRFKLPPFFTEFLNADMLIALGRKFPFKNKKLKKTYFSSTLL